MTDTRLRFSQDDPRFAGFLCTAFIVLCGAALVWVLTPPRDARPGVIQAETASEGESAEPAEAPLWQEAENVPAVRHPRYVKLVAGDDWHLVIPVAEMNTYPEQRVDKIHRVFNRLYERVFLRIYDRVFLRIHDRVFLRIYDRIWRDI